MEHGSIEGVIPCLRRAHPMRASSLIAALGLAAAGCDKGAPSTSVRTPPPAFADAAAVSAAVAMLDTVVATPPMLGLQAMGGLMKTAAAPARPPGSAALACAAVGRDASPPVAPAPVAPASAVAALIADTLYGRVFAYDTATGAYALSSGSGGPAQGVRFLVYAVNPYSLPVIPLATVGWLDLSDRSTASTLAAQAHLQGATAGLADYLVTVAGTRAADTAVLAGTIADGTHAFAWTDSTARAGFVTAIAASLADSASGVRVRMYDARTSFDPFDFNDTLDFSFAAAGDTVRLTGHIQTYCLVPSIGLSVGVGGQPFAIVTNSTTTVPNVTGVGGSALTPAQVQAVLDLLAGEERLYRALYALLVPVGLLLPS